MFAAMPACSANCKVIQRPMPRLCTMMVSGANGSDNGNVRTMPVSS